MHSVWPAVFILSLGPSYYIGLSGPYYTYIWSVRPIYVYDRANLHMCGQAHACLWSGRDRPLLWPGPSYDCNGRTVLVRSLARPVLVLNLAGPS